MGNSCSPGCRGWCLWWRLFVLSVFPLDVLDENWDVIESVSRGFLTYSSMHKCTSIYMYLTILTFIWPLWPWPSTYLNGVSNGTSPPQGQQLCQIVLKCMHHCTNYGPDESVVTTMSRLPASGLDKKTAKFQENRMRRLRRVAVIGYLLIRN